MTRHFTLLLLIVSVFWHVSHAKVRSGNPPDSIRIEEPRSHGKAKYQRIAHKGYVVGYNQQWLIPQWVAYELTPRETEGTIQRPKTKFLPDPLVIGRSATHEDYTRQKPYCRGHMAPFADMKWDLEAALESFYLTNVCPQDMSLNSGVWNRLEQHIRKLAKSTGDTIYICCGPIVESRHATIGANEVAVPSHFFKVLCRRHQGQWMAIGFLFRNEPCTGKLFDYACSVDEVEKATGLDFFQLPQKAIEDKIERSYDIKQW